MTDKPKLFPYLFLRIAGDSYTNFEKLELRNIEKTLDKLQALDKDYAKTEKQISDQLYKAISKTKESKSRNLLIQIRRDVHNKRKIDYARISLQDNLPKHLKRLLSKSDSLLTQSSKLETKGEKIYEDNYKKNYKIFLTLLKNQNFQNGLTLSSASLLSSLKKYLQLQKVTDKKNVKLERSLLRYLSRMYTKPTPLSSFTQIALGKISSSKQTEILASHAHDKIKNRIEINHGLYIYLYRLLIQNKVLSRHIKIKHNSTIQIHGEQYNFLVNSNNKEAFTQIAINDAVKAIYELIQTQKEWQYNDFVTHLHTHMYPDIEQQELEVYIDQLISMGFLEYDLGISFLDPSFDKKLITRLRPLSKHMPHIAELLETLKQLRIMSKKFGEAPVEKREKIRNKAYTLFRDCCYKLHIEAGLPENEWATAFTVQPQDLFFEDTYSNDEHAIPSPIKRNLDRVGEFLSHMQIFDTCREEKYHIEKLFLSRFKQDVFFDVLTFYEYYQQTLEQYKNKKESRDNAIVSKYRKEQQEALDTIVAHINSQKENKDQITLSKKHFSHLRKISPMQESSYGAYFQIYNKEQLVINDIAPGFGRMCGRFLTLFPPKLTNMHYKINTKESKDVLLAESTDASVYNGNLHPPLMPYEIEYPGAQVREKTKTIPIAEIEIGYDSQKKCLLLRHKKSRKRIYVFDLGFLNVSFRSNLYNFLTKFSRSDHHQYHMITDKIHSEIEKLQSENEIITLPRLVYEDCVVLKRKTWKIPIKSIPLKNIEEQDANYFIKINLWRMSYDIPPYIFIKTTNDKPQFISFFNPKLILLFGNYISKTKNTVVIEEMLPDPVDILRSNKNKFVTEFYAEWYKQ